MIITSTYQGRAKQENIFLIRYETNGEEKKLLKKAKTKEDATRQTNLPFPWTLIECALAYVVKVQRPIMASGADTLLIYSEDGRILPSLYFPLQHRSHLLIPIPP